MVSAECADEVIARCQEAQFRNADCGLRRGNVIHVSPADADEVMITADLHGHRLNFERIVELAALDAAPRRILVMQEVCHGGPSYPGNQGCMSHLMLEDVMALKARYGDRFHFLLSNHEWAELTDFPITKASRMLNLSFRCGLQTMYGDAADRVRKAYLSFISTCPLAVRLETGVFVCHSIPEDVETRGFDAQLLDRVLSESDFRPHGELFRLLWGRDFRAANAGRFADMLDVSLLVTGHEPCPLGYDVPNKHQIILDACGSPACVLTVPVNQRLSQQELLERLRQL